MVRELSCTAGFPLFSRHPCWGCSCSLTVRLFPLPFFAPARTFALLGGVRTSHETARGVGDLVADPRRLRSAAATAGRRVTAGVYHTGVLESGRARRTREGVDSGEFGV